MGRLRTFVTFCVLFFLPKRTCSAECDDEVLIPEGGKHEIPKEFVTSEIFINNTDILYGDIVNVEVEFVYADITVQSEVAPVKFAEKKLTEISVTLQGVDFLELGYVAVNQSFITTAYSDKVPVEETRLNVPVEEVFADSIIIRVSPNSKDTELKVSDLVLKACKEPDIDDCKPDSCLNGGTCKDGINSFTCQCAEGFDGSTCANNINDCKTDSCLNGGTCTDGINSFTCKCAEGFDGPTCENNIDDCASSPCYNGGTCSDGINEFSCDCVAGYSGENCEIAPRCQTIRCISKDCVYSECTLEEATGITKITLRQSFKKSSCYYYGFPKPGDYQDGDPGYFGYKDNIVWVDNGCKAILDVCYN